VYKNALRRELGKNNALRKGINKNAQKRERGKIYVTAREHEETESNEEENAHETELG
jgi:hypothetical protein